MTETCYKIGCRGQFHIPRCRNNPINGNAKDTFFQLMYFNYKFGDISLITEGERRLAMNDTFRETPYDWDDGS